MQPQDIIPSRFEGEVLSIDDAHYVSHQQPSQLHLQKQQLMSVPAKKPKGKKATAAGFLEHSSASGTGSSPSALLALTEGTATPRGKGKKVLVSAAADDHSKCWTCVKAWKKVTIMILFVIAAEALQL